MTGTSPARRFVPLLAALTIAVTANVAAAAPGDLDDGFGPNGKVVTSGGSLQGQDTGNGVAVQPDGKVVIAGAVGVSLPSDELHDVAVIRYRADGTRDPDFAGDGLFTMDVGGGQDFGYDVAIDASGRIVVAGTTYRGGDADVLVMRLTPAGTPDPTFGDGGVETTALSTIGDRARAVVVQPDGRIVVAGETGASGGGGDLFVARYTETGGLDRSFSGDGVATMDVLGGADSARDLVMQPNGAFVVTGSANDGSRGVIVVARFTAGGIADPTFSGDGRRTISLGPVANVGHGVALTPAGRIVVVGSRDTGSAATMVVAELRRGGPLVDEFSGDGKTTVSFSPGPELGYGVVVQDDGAIVAGGSALSPTGTTDFALARLTAAGLLDPAFGGGDGKVTTDFSGKNDACYALALAPDGSIVGTGGTRWGDATALEDVASARWRAA
jgi:serralysin